MYSLLCVNTFSDIVVCMNTVKRIPEVVFKTHTQDKNVYCADPFAWADLTSDEIFSNKKVVVFAILEHLVRPV